LNTAFFLRPRPFSFSVLSPALSVSASVAPSNWAATAVLWCVGREPAQGLIFGVEAARITPVLNSQPQPHDLSQSAAF